MLSKQGALLFMQVINVYEVIKRQLVQKKSLYGHCDGITCLAACSAYGLLVSGSRDRSAIIWDLARLAYVRQLAPHQAPVAAVAINEQTVSAPVGLLVITAMGIFKGEVAKALKL